MKLLIPLILFLTFISANAQTLPKIEREFRAIWIATVDNIDFPTKKNLSIEEQKAELIKDLELAKSLKMNAVIFQVRPMADAVYESKIEPWSEFLTGEMGKSQPFDPLKFIIEEAHKRGILVHAWFNPYRAYHPAAKTVSENHISKRRPDLVRQYGKYMWLDPTDPEVQQYSLSVVLDVVKRYDIDGVHFDDYFYPYAEKDEKGNKIEFPDDANYQKYVQAALNANKWGKQKSPLSRETWRRMNVNNFVASVGREIKKIKPNVMYGISPIGVQDINYNELFADAEFWLSEGIVDYFVPQLYWKIDRKNREFPLLLKFWESKNVKNRHVWAGIGTYKIPSKTENFSAQEIINQISLTREIQKTAGNIQFSFKSVNSDFDGIQNALREKSYQREAVIPLSPWIKSAPPLTPKVEIQKDEKIVRAKWTEQGSTKAFWFIVYAKDKNGWSYSILPASQKSIALSADRKIEKIIVKSVDRLGNESK
ncbi:MAG: family 10 glycosylhydrolase [Pyrinomonadaceae bacterium]|nr:family 10 glycosylhydrolase [Pyrinomonadaceae bacterium]